MTIIEERNGKVIIYDDNGNPLGNKVINYSNL